MRKLEPTSALCLFLFFCNEKRGLIVMGLHHQTNAFMKSSPRLLQSSSGVIRRSQRRAENNVQRSDCSQDKEESAVDEFDFNVLPDREGTGSVKVSVTPIFVVRRIYTADAGTAFVDYTRIEPTDFFHYACMHVHQLFYFNPLMRANACVIPEVGVVQGKEHAANVVSRC